jgi:hypothetical protein
MESKFFDDARTMFLTDGWKEFVEGLDEAIAGCTLDACQTSEQFWEMRGRLTTLRQVAGYENSVLSAEQLQEDDNA